MNAPTVRVERDGGLAHLVLDRPEAGNAIDLPLAEALHGATSELAVWSGLRAVLISGAGPRFCVGGDLRSFAAAGDGTPTLLREITVHLHAAVLGLVRLHAPVVVAVQGSAAGAGVSLACAGDIVVAGHGATFVLAYTAVGLSPDGGATYLLPRLVGPRRATELCLTNRRLTAGEALEWGLVTEVCDDGDVLAVAHARAEALALGPTRALATTRRLLHDSATATLEDQLEAESLAISEGGGTPEGREGIAAFLERRQPRFSPAPEHPTGG